MTAAVARAAFFNTVRRVARERIAGLLPFETDRFYFSFYAAKAIPLRVAVTSETVGIFCLRLRQSARLVVAHETDIAAHRRAWAMTQRAGKQVRRGNKKPGREAGLLFDCVCSTISI
jgi:hypothetical protein